MTGILHRSDCAVHNGPAIAPGPCDCGVMTTAKPDTADYPLSLDQVTQAAQIQAVWMILVENGVCTREELDAETARAKANTRPGQTRSG